MIILYRNCYHFKQIGVSMSRKMLDRMFELIPNLNLLRFILHETLLNYRVQLKL